MSCAKCFRIEWESREIIHPTIINIRCRECPFSTRRRTSNFYEPKGSLHLWEWHLPLIDWRTFFSLFLSFLLKKKTKCRLFLVFLQKIQYIFLQILAAKFRDLQSIRNENESWKERRKKEMSEWLEFIYWQQQQKKKEMIW